MGGVDADVGYISWLFALGLNWQLICVAGTFAGVVLMRVRMFGCLGGYRLSLCKCSECLGLILHC